MSNLIQYIIQDDPEEELKKKQSQTLLSRELSSRQDTDKNYKFNSRHLLENDFSHLQSKPAPTARSYLSQALAKNVAKEGNKVNSALSPKPIGHDAASYKIAQNNKGNVVNDTNIPSGKFSDKELTERMLPIIKDKEKPLDYIYIDTTWNKTTGAGANVDDWNTFNKVNWEINGRSATEEEKRATFDYFDKITSKGKQNVDEKGKLLEKNNKRADFYSNKSQLRISSNETDRLLRNHITEDIKYLQKEFPDFASYPPELQNVLLDIKFNTGNVSQENWPKLRKAISEKNLFGKEGILKNAHRKDVGEDRNLWAEQQIRNIKSW